MLKVFELFKKEEFNESFKIKKGLEILGFNEIVELETQQYVLNLIIEYVFNLNVPVSKNNTILFDYNLDFSHYYVDFLNLGVDLLADNVSWFKFDLILNEILVHKGTRMCEVMEYRTYEKPQKIKSVDAMERLEHKQKMELKRQYSLPQNQISIDESLNKLWNYVEKKAGDINE